MDDPDTHDEGPIGPGSPRWAERLHELHEEEPSPHRYELIRVADALRALLHRLTNSSAPTEVLARSADELEAIADELKDYERSAPYAGFAESANAGGMPHAFFDNSPMLGRANALAPPINLRLVDDQLIGGAVFGAAYEGPPGCVHGGFVAAAFDEVLGSTQSLSGSPGMTARLIVNYRKPTPLHTPLTFVGRLDRVDGRKIFTLGELWAGDVLCAEAEGLFISIDPGAFIELKQARDARSATT
jgi:hypothetical protein